MPIFLSPQLKSAVHLTVKNIDYLYQYNDILAMYFKLGIFLKYTTRFKVSILLENYKRIKKKKKTYFNKMSTIVYKA